MGIEALPAEWQATAGDDYSALRPFLKADGRVAASLPFLPSRGWAVPNKIVPQGDGRYIAVVPGQPSFRLDREDITYLRLDIRRLQREICEATGLTAAPLREVIAAHAWQIAMINAGAGMNLSVYLAYACEPADLDRVIVTLIARDGSPFFLMTPTSDRYTPESRHVLTSRAAEHTALSDLVEMDDSGTMRACMPIDDVITRLQLACQARENSLCAEPYVFRRDGDVWEVAFKGNSKRVKALRGMAYIHESLSRPYRPIHVRKLATIGVSAVVRPHRGPNDPIIDDAGHDALDQRAADLREELDAARERGDANGQERILNQIRDLAVHATARRGKRGRKRQTTDDGDRCRVAARKAYTDAIKAIAKVHPALATYLTNQISTGYSFQYVPTEELPWAL